MYICKPKTKTMSTFQDIESHISSLGFTYERKDFERPWGGFLVIEEHQAQQFSDQFFSGLDVNTLKISGKLSPKILIVQPEARLSWQYHHRRAEIWRVYKGSVGIIALVMTPKAPWKSTTSDQITLNKVSVTFIGWSNKVSFLKYGNMQIPIIHLMKMILLGFKMILGVNIRSFHFFIEKKSPTKNSRAAPPLLKSGTFFI